MANETYVELKGINKSFGDFKASKDISFGIQKGRLIGLLGPSGSGKTTILRMLAGLETADSGDIIIDGKVVNDVPASQRGIGFVFQNYALFRYMTVWDNIAFGLQVQKWPKEKIRSRVEEMLELVGLSQFAKRYPNQLSGGQRQRVAFARALAPNPQLLLLDEPFAAVDAKVRKELRSWLRQMPLHSRAPQTRSGVCWPTSAFRVCWPDCRQALRWRWPVRCCRRCSTMPWQARMSSA